MSKKLPHFVKPMLARRGAAFNSEDYLFEIKWDGFRAIGLVDHDEFRFYSRNQLDFRPSFPEFDFLAALPAGTVFDSEIVALKEGMPSFQVLLQRFKKRSFKVPPGYATALVAFDIMYYNFKPVMNEPLVNRREILQQALKSIDDHRLIISDGLVGQGILFHQQAVERGLEGVIAKKLQGQYLAGRRSDSWIKIKKHQQVYCSIIGYLPKSKNSDFKSLLLASDIDGTLSYIGNVGTGFKDSLRAEIMGLLKAYKADKPLVVTPTGLSPAPVFVHAGLYCKVSFLELTEEGLLRAPVFEQLIHEE